MPMWLIFLAPWLLLCYLTPEVRTSLISHYWIYLLGHLWITSDNHATLSISGEPQAVEDGILEACRVTKTKECHCPLLCLVLTVHHQMTQSPGRYFSEWLGKTSTLTSISCSSLSWVHHCFDQIPYCTSDPQQARKHTDTLKNRFILFLFMCIHLCLCRSWGMCV